MNHFRTLLALWTWEDTVLLAICVVGWVVITLAVAGFTGDF